MNSLSLVTLVSILINISFGFKTNCTSTVGEPCSVWLEPGEPAYEIFHLCLTDSDKELGVGLLKKGADLSEIEKENILIQTKVSEDAKKTFFTSLNDRPYASNRNIVIVPNDSRMGSRLNKQRRK
uniref:Uncharacterized protein n=1 Tax=Strongyloides papillosus TaxID=174720 RepID=A0A0N5BYI2_STREA